MLKVSALNEVIKLGVWSELEYFNDDRWMVISMARRKLIAIIFYIKNKKEGTRTWECNW